MEEFCHCSCQAVAVVLSVSGCKAVSLFSRMLGPCSLCMCACAHARVWFAPGKRSTVSWCLVVEKAQVVPVELAQLQESAYQPAFGLSSRNELGRWCLSMDSELRLIVSGQVWTFQSHVVCSCFVHLLLEIGDPFSL